MTTELCVMLLLVAAVAIVWVVRPQSTGAAAEYLLPSKLVAGDENACVEPSVEISCDESGNVVLRCRGLSGITMSGAISAKVIVKGFDIFVNERAVAGSETGAYASEAVFTLDFLASERYFLRYESEENSAAVSFAFRNVAGFHTGPHILRQ